MALQPEAAQQPAWTAVAGPVQPAEEDHPPAPEASSLMSEDWRAKLRALCAGLGPTGDAVYSEIAGAVDDWGAEEYRRGYDEGSLNEIQLQSYDGN